jgi:protein required for attachment to host cells
MSDRQATPDVLSALMSGTAVKEESNKTLKQESNKAIKKESHKARIKQLVIEGTEEAEPVFEEELKEKATFNLPVKLLEELEDKCHEIRKMCGSKQISKTLIVEEALRLAFVEFDLKKHLSKFYSKLESNKAVKQ